MAENTAVPPAQDPNIPQITPDTSGGGQSATPTTSTTPTTPATPAQPTQPAQISDDVKASLKDEITRDISGKVGEEVSKSVIERIAEALGLNKKEEAKLPTDAESLKKLVDEAVQKRMEAEAERAEEQEIESKEQRQIRINGIILGWHGQYNEMAKLGKVPAIKNANDANDEGVVARRKIILAIGKIIDEYRKTDPNSEYTPSVSEVLIRFPRVLEAPPGADLPISGNNAVRGNESSFSYQKDVKGKTFEQIASEANSA